MINEQDILELFIKSIRQQIEALEGMDTDPNNTVLDELKLLLSDNVSENGNIHVRSSLLNKAFHLSFSNYKFYMSKYDNEHLHN
ncbi:MAG: hypothetical protein ACYSTS_07545 [Planctomycetota bacterium]|jgi:hypothetical protein